MFFLLLAGKQDLNVLFNIVNDTRFFLITNVNDIHKKITL